MYITVVSSSLNKHLFCKLKSDITLHISEWTMLGHSQEVSLALKGCLYRIIIDTPFLRLFCFQNYAYHDYCTTVEKASSTCKSNTQTSSPHQTLHNVPVQDGRGRQQETGGSSP